RTVFVREWSIITFLLISQPQRSDRARIAAIGKPVPEPRAGYRSTDKAISNKKNPGRSVTPGSVTKANLVVRNNVEPSYCQSLGNVSPPAGVQAKKKVVVLTPEFNARTLASPRQTCIPPVCGVCALEVSQLPVVELEIGWTWNPQVALLQPPLPVPLSVMKYATFPPPQSPQVDQLVLVPDEFS